MHAGDVMCNSFQTVPCWIAHHSYPYAQRPTCAPSQPRRCVAACTVFVGNLPWSVTDESMKEWFSEIGEVVAVRIAEDYETGKRKGFGHVEFASPESAQKAMEFNGEELEGRALRIDVSAPRARETLTDARTLMQIVCLLACVRLGVDVVKRAQLYYLSAAAPELQTCALYRVAVACRAARGDSSALLLPMPWAMTRY
jgi:hypothetical protein